MIVRSACFLMIALFVGIVAAQVEEDPWADVDGLDPGLRELLQRDLRGELLDPGERNMVEEYLRHNLIRPRMTILESSLYSIAEIHIKRGEHAQAIQALQQVILTAQEKESEVVWTTWYNIAQVYRRHLRDLQKALESFEKVKGRWRDRAFSEAVAMLEDAADTERAEKLIERAYAAAQEKGHKLALLHRLARFYKKTNQDDKALDIYQRIGKEATPQEIAAMKQATRDFVRMTIEAILKHRDREEWREAEELERKLGTRERELREQGRWDEHGAFQDAMREAEARFEAWERARERGEREQEKPAPRGI